MESGGTLTFDETTGDVAILKVNGTLTVDGEITTEGLRSGALASRPSINSVFLTLTE